MNPTSPVLLDAITMLVAELPFPVTMQVAAAIRSMPLGAWSALLVRAQQAAGTAHARNQVGQLLTAWEQSGSTVLPESVALALESTALTVSRLRAQQLVEVVWTGPTTTLPVRRTAQALQQVIDEAQQELIIVSFVVYDVPEIGHALVRAANRGVRISLIIESPQESAGKIAYDGLAAFGPQVVARATVLHWPYAQRLQDAAGKRGSLHAKCAVADATVAFVSSANFTHYALNLNMELGLIVHGGMIPRQIAEHWRELTQQGALVPVALV